MTRGLHEDTVRSTYDAVAASYADAMANELGTRPIERALLDQVAQSSTRLIADLGCGPGHVTQWLFERGAIVLGIDLSPAMIDIARARGTRKRSSSSARSSLSTAQTERGAERSRSTPSST